MRTIALLSGLALLGAACASDGAAPIIAHTTVPSVTTVSTPPPPPTSTTPPPSSTQPATTTAVVPNGDLAAVEISTLELTSLSEPIATATAPNGEWWIAQRGGTIVVVDPNSGAVGDTVLDISERTEANGERGLLGMAVDSTALYLNYTDLAGDTHIDQWELDSAGRPSTRTELLFIEQPYSNHNGGGLAIGPDGFLYVGVGDGGKAGDPHGAGQDPTQLLGSILRINPSSSAGTEYSIPADNPYADGVDGRPEIFMIGARNPWRLSFDPQTNDLWIADVGQNMVEEVDLLLGANGWGLGANLGWKLREGSTPYTGERPENNVDPVYEYPHEGTLSGCSVTGGFVYRGAAIPELVGAYVFGDFCTSRVWAISITTGEVLFRDLGTDVPGGQLASFGLDPDGEIVALSLAGPVSRIVAR